MSRVFALALVLLAASPASLPQTPSPSQSGSPNFSGSPPGPMGAQASAGASLFYLLMSSRSAPQRPGFWPELLGDNSISPEEIEKLNAHANHAWAANLEFQLTQKAKMCAGKDTLTSLDAVAAALTKSDASNADNIEQLGNESAKSLGERLGKLLKAAATRSTFRVVETDHKTLMTAMKRDPVTHIQRACSGSSPQPAP